MSEQQREASHQNGAGSGEGAAAHPGMALPGRRHHPQEVSSNNLAGYNLPGLPSGLAFHHMSSVLC